jgi:hypothetical protein
MPIKKKPRSQEEERKHRRHESRRKRREELRAAVSTGPIQPDFFYRLADGSKWFGYRSAQLFDAINKGIVPKPIALSDTGRAKGWFGRTILAWQAERERKAAEEKAA